MDVLVTLDGWIWRRFRLDEQQEDASDGGQANDHNGHDVTEQRNAGKYGTQKHQRQSVRVG